DWSSDVCSSDLATGTSTRVQLDAQQPHGVQPETYRPFGVTGVEPEHEALAPVLQFVLAAGVIIPPVPVHVEVAGFQRQAAVVDELRTGWQRRAAHCHCHSQ